MSDLLEDYDDDQQYDEQQADALNKEIFGEDDDEYQPGVDHGQLEDEFEEQEEPVAVQSTPGVASAAERKARLEQLTQKKKKREDGDKDDDVEQGRRKKQKGSKSGKTGKKGDEAPKQGRLQRRSLAAAAAEPTAEHGEAVDRDGDEEEHSEDFRETEADQGFIDDAGAAAVDSEGDEEERLRIEQAQEAEEASGEEDDVDRLLKGKKRKKKEENHAQMQVEVDDMLSKMDAAMEDDFETVARNMGIEIKKDSSGQLVKDAEGRYIVAHKGPPAASKQPAVSKLKMIQEVDMFLAQKKYHESFINGGGLGVLKGWLEPYQDGTLPNVRVRSMVLRACQLLPIDTRNEDDKENLRKSQLGKNVMFLFKCQDETADNKRIAKELVHKWSRPIFYDHEAEEAKKKAREQQLVTARRQEMEKTSKVENNAATEEARKKAVRIHALIPQGSKLDYVVNPERSRASQVANVNPVGTKANRDSLLNKKLREQKKKSMAGSARAMKPSIEGRGIVLRN